MAIYALVALALVFVAVGFVLLPLLALADLILVILATVKASKGEGYRYPATIRFIK